MPITEIVTPILKSSHESVPLFKSQLRPMLHAALSKAPGVSGRQYFGRMLYENNEPVQEFRFALGIEWDTEDQFHTFMKTEDFQAFVGQLKNHVYGPPNPQIYDTGSSTTTVFSSPITEVFRIPIPDLEIELAAKGSWKKLIDSLRTESLGINELSGTSLNLEEKLFLGVLGWDGTAVREQVLSRKDIKGARGVLERLGGGSFVVEFAKAGLLPSD